MLKSFLIVISTTFFSQFTFAQLPVSLTLPQSSPFEERCITIGLTEIGFEYSSVGIKEREIWGELVPYGEVWRTGANRNTVFTISDDVLINGEELRAGSYGLHTIPGENEWILIFSNFSEAWGSYFYDESEDALRITVPAEKMDSKYEWMKFSFSDYTPTSVEISLKWAYRKIPFTVEVPMEVTFKNIEKQFKTLPAFGWQGWVQGANYTLNNEYRLDKGLEWAEEALRIERNLQTIGTVGKLYVLNNKKEKGFEYATELTKTWPENWRSYYSAAEIFETAGENNRAREAYLKARDLVTDQNSKYVIQRRTDQLQ
ncbi:MAG: DUF2911 domain-containing protein [Balneolaceae bacterium]|nr:DUF2911 domain-containing protein [Balneolaceae bacterium]MBO6547396.1 DUF2911 domain-containing protein [Balneolaceae bacterium]MBO6647657.1 DUF2911 domain-containing protein [Balneolaceae bacterium]